MSIEITIILAKASWCHHCQNFMPIFEQAAEKIKTNNNFANKTINFVTYDVEDPSQKNSFMNEHPGLIDFLEGYPTVYMKIKKDNNIRTDFINHKTIEKKIGETLSEKEKEKKNIRSSG